jgi:polyisoprenoid-binding protein YceI
VSLPPRSANLGPSDATLSIHTGRSGPAARAGHDLELAVRSWSATLRVGETPEASSLTLRADSASIAVLSGAGGAKALSGADKAKIEKTIAREILKGSEIRFRSGEVRAAGDDRLSINGELELLGATGPVRFELQIEADGSISASTTMHQTAFGIEPYSTMFGTLRLADAVEIRIRGTLPPT